MINKPSYHVIRNAIFKGGTRGLLLGTILYAFLSVRFIFIKVFGEAAFYFSEAQFLGIRIAVVIFFVLLGSLIGWYFGRLRVKKQIYEPAAQKYFFAEWGFIILIFIISAIFYPVSITATYECEINTVGLPLGRDKCYSEKLICNKITDENIKILCHYKKSDLNISICNETDNLDEKNRCLGLVAGSRTDPTICNQIGDRRWKNFCYSRVAVYDGVKSGKWYPNLCEQITDIDAKEDCYYRASQLECNTSWCRKINNSAVQNSCLGAIEMIMQGIGCEQNLSNMKNVPL